MPKNEFNKNNISNSTIYNNQTNIINGENKIPINNCIEQNIFVYKYNCTNCRYFNYC